MIDEGTKIDTDTTRVVDEDVFNAAFADEPEGDTSTATVGEEVQATEAPAAPSDATVAEAHSSAEASSKPAETLLDGYTRDAAGRIHRPDGTIASKFEIERVTQPAPVTSPFQYRAYGQTKAVEGYVVNADGSITVAAEHAGALRHLHSMAESFNESSNYADQLKAKLAEKDAEIEELRKGSTAEIARANALVDSYSKALQEPDDEKAVLAFFDLRQKLPVLLARAEADHYKSLASQGKPKPSAEPAPQADIPVVPTREIAARTATEHVERLKLDYQYRDLTADEWKQIEGRIGRNPNAYTRVATPEEAQRLGIAPGTYVFDDIMLAEDVKDWASPYRAARETAKAAKFNVQTPAPKPQKKPASPQLVTAGAERPSADQAFNDAWNRPLDD